MSSSEVQTGRSALILKRSPRYLSTAARVVRPSDSASRNMADTHLRGGGERGEGRGEGGGEGINTEWYTV